MSALQGCVIDTDSSRVQRHGSQFRDHHQQRGAMEIYRHLKDHRHQQASRRVLGELRRTDALALFPLHSLVSTMTATINNNTISSNVQETLPVLLRLLDQEELAKYNDMTPTALDHLAHYGDSVDYMSYQIDIAPGAGNIRFPAIYNVDAAEDPTHNGTRSQAFISYPNNVLGFDMNRSISERMPQNQEVLGSLSHYMEAQRLRHTRQHSQTQ